MDARELCRDNVAALGSPVKGTSYVLFDRLRVSYTPVRLAMGSNVLLGVDDIFGAVLAESRAVDRPFSATTALNSVRM
jgi:hypothetical protein